MSIKSISTEKLVQKYASRTEIPIPKHTENRLEHLGQICEKNLRIKAAMARELVDIGLSKEAIKRVLHIEFEVKDARHEAFGG
jgi:ribosomal protein L30E